jgi:hypothetical protein
MFIKRLLLVGVVVAATIAVGVPASAKGRMTFVVSGGDLKRSVSFESSLLDSVHGWWWRPESRIPELVGSRYRLQLYDAASPTLVTEWIYLPDVPGALPTGPVASRGRANDGLPIKWIAFSQTFNAAFLRQIRASAEGAVVSTLVVVGAGILLILTAMGLGFDVMPRWLLRQLAARMRAPTIAPDAGPAFLYTSVPRSLWTTVGHLGRAPHGLAGPP